MRTIWDRIILAVALAAFAFAFPSTAAEGLRTRHVFLVISDGYRWQEVFTGVEEGLISRETGVVVDTNALRQKFWRPTPEARREELMPFFWTEIAKRGQILGNRNKGSIVDITNGKNFSYPGYNEILTGYGDPRVKSNAKILNPTATVFEWIERQPGFGGRVGVVGTWDVFPFIFNCERSKLPIWPAWKNSFATEIKVPELVQELAADTPWLGHDIIFDSFAIQVARDYIHREKPRLCFIGFGETDEFAHHGMYDAYLEAGHRVDRFVRELWEYAQATDGYRDATTIIVTADHGRGSGPVNWRSHGEDIPESKGDWMAVLGPDTPALGERSNHHNTQTQIAATIASLLGLDYRAFYEKAGEPIREVIGAAKP
jgi:hypothetical protein